MNPWTALVVDDHPLFLRTLREFLEEQSEIAVVAEAVNGRQAVELAAAHRPQVVLMDVQMPQLDGIAACRKIKQARPETRVILYSGSDLEVERAAAARCADACLSKHTLFNRLPTAVAGAMTSGNPETATSD